MRFTVCQITKDAKTDPRAMDAMVLGKVDPVFFLSSYEEVCAIEADNLDEVFQIGNVGPEAKIERFGRMHSVSVGDVIRDDRNRCFVVSGLGFERLGA